MRKSKSQQDSSSGKYTSLIIAIIAFIVFIVSILLMNFYIADQIGRDTEVIDIAGRQRTISQRVTRAITEFELFAIKQSILAESTLDKDDYEARIEEDISAGEGLLVSDFELGEYGDFAQKDILTEEQIELDNFYVTRLEELRGELQDQVAIFDWTLDGFINGGKTLDSSNQSIDLAPVPTQEAQLIARETEAIWGIFKKKVDILMVIPASEYLNQNEINSTLLEASTYAQKNNLRILKLMNDLTQELTRNASEKTIYLRFIQFGGLIGALLFFLLIMYYIVLRLRTADKKLDAAKQETDEIMANVNGGLFLLDNKLKIGSQHSKELANIFNDEKIAGKKFDSMLKELLTKDTLETATDYIELLLGDRVNEKLVAGLNPMNEVEINIPNGKGSFDTKYLEFSFNRTTRGDEQKHLLVTVNDISERIQLTRKLEESHEHREAQLELLMNILHIDPQELLIFIDEAEISLNKINDILRESGTSNEDNRNKVSKIFRIAHSLKGDAAALDLETFERMAHQFEDELDQIKRIQTPDGNDFIPLVVKLEDLLNHLQSIKEIALRLSDLSTAVAKKTTEQKQEPAYIESDTNSDNWAFIEQLRHKVSDSENKEVAIVQSGIDDKTIPRTYYKLVRDTVIQLIRNAIVHGIEAPDIRESSKKPRQGQIQLSFQQTDDENYELTFRDDGQGISRRTVVRTAIERGIISEKQANNLQSNQIYALIFHPNFSTANQSSIHAGRGVGMDVIKERVKEAGGKLRFKTVTGKYTEFKIILPSTTETEAIEI